MESKVLKIGKKTNHGGYLVSERPRSTRKKVDKTKTDLTKLTLGRSQEQIDAEKKLAEEEARSKMALESAEIK